MSKSIVKQPLGADGGFAELVVEEGNLVVKAGYPVAKILEPIKKNFVDKLKTAIPGTWDDVIIDNAWNEAVKIVTE